MYVTKRMVNAMAKKYCKPETAQFEFPLNNREYQLILASREKLRLHDFTVYAMHKDQVVVIAKHNYPPGIYRAPSGGVHPKEKIEAGIMREVAEEIGCEIKLKKFLLQSNVVFTYKKASINWTTYVFLAQYIDGDFDFTDTREIREVRWAKLKDFAKFNRLMRKTKIGGFHYRAALHERVAELLK